MQILFVDGCVRGAVSRTRRLANAFLDALCARFPDARVETADLNALRPLPLFGDTLAARDAAMGDWAQPCFDAARQFREADLIVFAAPFWEGTFPAALHAYLEHICVTGLTFGYAADGTPEGYCRAACAVFFSTRGGIYSSGPARADDHAEAFLGSIVHLLGIPRMDTITAEGLDIIGADVEGILAEAETRARALADRF